jgi:hypothetical protein
MSIPREVSEPLLSAEPDRPVLSALRVLVERDSYLLSVDANERSITHRLAMYLQAELKELDVDCEYNRTGLDPKRVGHLDLCANPDDTDAQSVFPDIIAHARGTQERNYLAIELKKDTRRIGREVDRQKLRAYRHELRYRFALFIELQTGQRPGVANVEWVE